MSDWWELKTRALTPVLRAKAGLPTCPQLKGDFGSKLHLTRRVSSRETAEGRSAGSGRAQGTVVGMVQDVEEISLQLEAKTLLDGKRFRERGVCLFQPRQHDLPDARIAEGAGRRCGESCGIQPLCLVSGERKAVVLQVNRLPRNVVCTACSKCRSAGVDAIERTALQPKNACDHEPADRFTKQEAVSFKGGHLVVYGRDECMLTVDVELAVVVLQILKVRQVAAIARRVSQRLCKRIASS